MTGGEERDHGPGLIVWAQDARVRSAAYATQAVRAAESAAAMGEQADRSIERLAERNPEHAKCLRAIMVTAGRRRAVIAERKRGYPVGQPGGQPLPAARTGPEVVASTGLAGHLRDSGIVPDGDRATGELRDEVIQRIFTAGLTLQDAAGLTTEPDVRWQIEAAADDLDELIRVLRDALFDPADRRP